jgi:hypothetical protein
LAVEEARLVSAVKPIVADGFDLAALEVGRVVEARVMSIASGLAVLASRQGTMQADLSALGAGAAAVGDVLRLAVTAVATGNGAQKLTLALAENPAAAASTPPTAAAPSPADALARAARTAAAGQNGLAPLYASLAGLADAPEGALPEAVRTLARSLMAGRLAADGAPTATDVARAFAASGLFREARGSGGDPRDLKAGLGALKSVLTAWLGGAAASPRAPTAPTPGTVPSGTAEAGAGAGGAATAIPAAARRIDPAYGQPVGTPPGQVPAASLAARMASARYAGATVAAPATGTTSPATGRPISTTLPSGPATVAASGAPPAVVPSVAAVPAATVPSVAVAAAPGAPAAAVPAPGGAASGTNAVVAAPSATPAAGAAVDGDGAVATAMPTGAAVSGATARPGAVATPIGADGAVPSAASVATAPAGIAGAGQGLDPSGLGAAASANAAGLAAGAIADRVMRPPPPRRGQPTRGQAALAPETAADADAVTALGRRALERTDGALKRILLEQFAVLDRSVDEAAAVGARPAGWTAELPLATGSGTGVVQMTVERDTTGGGKGRPEASVAWRVRFSLDVEPIGPVHARIGLSGERMSIGLWVERPEMAERLAAEIGTLGGALEAAAIPVEGLHVQVGQPAATKPSGSAHFIDVSL